MDIDGREMVWRRWMRLCRALAGAMAICGVPCWAAEVVAVDVPAAYDAATAGDRKQLAQLAEWCRGQGWNEQAAAADGWLPMVPADKELYFLIDSQAEAAADARPAPAKERAEFAARFQALRDARAEQLFALAQQAVAAGKFSLAVRLTYETLRENPRHAAARKLLGYQEVEGQWLTRFELTKRRGGQVWHLKYGWIARDHVARYEAGERYLNGRWVTADDDARIHATIDKGWDIDTENFRIRTNHSLEEGVRLAARLEMMHQVWRQMFARYHTAEAEWRRLFAGGEPRDVNRQRYNVVYFRNKDEYVRALEKSEPQIAVTSGFFSIKDEKAYFFADAEKRNDEFLFHEVTHQLFTMTRPTFRVGQRGNFWIVEGIACQMESLVLHDDWAEAGGGDNPRMAAARARLLTENPADHFYMPLAEFTALSLLDFQKHARLATLYSQAAGQASFLMYGEKGRYREATVDYLLDVYSNRATPTTLAQRTGRTFAELDAEYRKYIEGLPARQN